MNEFDSIDLMMVSVDGFDRELWVMSISLPGQSNVLSPDKKAIRGCLPPQEPPQPQPQPQLVSWECSAPPTLQYFWILGSFLYTELKIPNF